MKKTGRYSGKDHTFVLCAYGESEYLESCIRSLQSQSTKSRLCVATSTPNEHIRSLAKRYGLKLRVNEVRDGIASDWNFALSCADTPLVTLAHQDDIYCEDYTKNVLEVLNKCAHPLLAFTDYCELREGATVRTNRLLRVKRLMLSPLKIERLWGSRFVRRRILSIGSAICCPSVTMVKEHLQLPVFRNNMKSNIDWQAWAEISARSGEFAYVAKPCMKHRIHEDSTTSKLLQENKRIEEDLTVFRMFWPEWIARLIERFYRSGERSNET